MTDKSARGPLDGLKLIGSLYRGLVDPTFDPGQAAESHWLTYGINQGRVASKTFSAAAYLQLNPDVAGAYGANNFAAAISHYVSGGRAEGRSTTAVATAGMQHVAALTNGGTAATGQNTFGQLGDGGTSTATSIVVPHGLGHGVTEVVAGDYSSFAVKPDGTLWMWGSNQYGARGDGSAGGSIVTPVQVPIPARVLTPVRNGKHAIASGLAAYAALDTDGEVWTWGMNWNGRLGDGTTANHLTPARVKRSAAANDYLTGIVSVVAAAGTMAAIDADGIVWTWGAGTSGALGNGSTQDSAYAVQVVQMDANNASVPLAGITQVACGSSGFCIALARYGGVFGWGSNDFSQMGIAPGGSFSVATPIAVGSGGIDAIAAGASHCIAHSTLDDTVYGWGYNGRGQLGAGFANAAVFPPIQMSAGPDGMNNVNQLAAAGDFSIMVRYGDRAVFAAGDNQSGQLALPSSTQPEYLPVSASLTSQ